MINVYHPRLGQIGWGRGMDMRWNPMGTTKWNPMGATGPMRVREEGPMRAQFAWDRLVGAGRSM